MNELLTQQTVVFEADALLTELELLFDDPKTQQLQAQAALADILTIQSEDDTARSFEQIQAESEHFFANDIVQEIDARTAVLAAQYAAFCDSHNHQADALNGPLADLYGRGSDHLETNHSHSHDDESTEKDKAKKKKKLNLPWGWLNSGLSFFNTPYTKQKAGFFSINK